TLSGFSAALSPAEGGGLNVNDASVVITDIVGTNGIIHVVDSVLLPANIVDLAIYNPNFSTLVAAVVEAGLASALTDGTFTVFAPTNDAFADLLAALGATPEELLAREDLGAILTYHVLSGEVRAEDATAIAPSFVSMLSGLTSVVAPTETGLAINDANIVVTDVVGTNGVIHAIDSVILPANIPGLLGFHPDYSSLVAAVGAEGLGDALAGDNLTLFAPDNAAIQALADTLFGGSITDLLAFDGLTTVLTYHVVAGRVQSSGLTNGEVTMLSGESATVNLSSTVPSIEGVGITDTDLEVSNGYIHLVNAVMVPPSIASGL
ncbi:MAG: fasciclin domain-containing protein, partial [Myxococcales bacterium]|nr:fasciclin domain-containing protein [Myxococcales bacterium]